MPANYGTKFRITKDGAIIPLSEEKFEDLWYGQKNNHTYDKYTKLIINVWHKKEVLLRKGINYFCLSKKEIESILSLCELRDKSDKGRGGGSGV